MEMSTAPGSWSVGTVVEQDKEDTTNTAAAAPSIHTSNRSNADERELEVSANDRAKWTLRVDKRKGRDQKKHGVMSLPAEIRETYAFQSPDQLEL